VVSIALQMRKLLDMRKVGLGQLTMESLNAAAINIGRVAIGSMFLCTEDMPTCEANAVISPVASFEDGLRFEDLVLAKEILAETIERIDKLEAGRLTQARTEVKELAPLLEAALKELR
ncbi:MAG: hypothetical protein KDE47_18040, partial [Caldilineaceae bacterium]|nr:hypothetical protein [Caldilineaceae bacterium]